MTYSITILNTDQAYKINPGHSLLNNLLVNGNTTHAKCGGKAICGRCRVKITSGNESCNKPRAEEKVILTQHELEQGWRLSCQTFCLRNISLYLPSIEEVE